MAVLDEGDTAIRASRGNFGLVWRQMKGIGYKPYADITNQSISVWRNYADELKSLTGTDCAYKQTGGLLIAGNTKELEHFVRMAEGLRKQTTDNSFDFQLYDRKKLKTIYPGIGSDVPGAVFCKDDGICNPLRFFRSLHEAMVMQGVDYRPNNTVKNISKINNGGFQIATDTSRFECEKVVLAAGLGNHRLAPMVGLNAPVKPLSGQLLVTERVQNFNPLPCNVFRANDEGTLLLGASEKDAGFDTSLDILTSGSIADNCLKIFPWLGQLRIIRMWSALRVMTADGKPIYQQSQTHPGAFVATCHSGVTLAAFHGNELADAIVAGVFPDSFNAFKAERFNV